MTYVTKPYRRPARPSRGFQAPTPRRGVPLPYDPGKPAPARSGGPRRSSRPSPGGRRPPGGGAPPTKPPSRPVAVPPGPRFPRSSPFWYAMYAAKYYNRLRRPFSPLGTALDIALYLLEDYVPPVPNEILLFPPSSYVQHCLIVGASINTMSSLYAGNVCNTGQYFSPGFPATATSPWVSGWDVQNPMAAANICTVVYERTAPATADPQVQPYVPGVPAKWFFPDELPEIARPSPLPYPRPGVQREPPSAPDPSTPEYVPTRQPAIGPGPDAFPFTYYPGGPALSPQPVPPVVVVTVEPSTGPNKPPVVTTPGLPATPDKPPGPRTKEKKGRTPRSILAAVGVATEGLDLVAALYEALPKSVKVHAYRHLGRQPNPWEKAVLLYEHLDEISIPAAVYNIAANEIEDRIIGGLNRRAKNPHTGFPDRGGLPTQLGPKFNPFTFGQSSG